MAKRRALGRALTGFADAFMPAWEGMERRKRLAAQDKRLDAQQERLDRAEARAVRQDAVTSAQNIVEQMQGAFATEGELPEYLEQWRRRNPDTEWSDEQITSALAPGIFSTAERIAAAESQGGGPERFPHLSQAHQKEIFTRVGLPDYLRKIEGASDFLQMPPMPDPSGTISLTGLGPRPPETILDSVSPGFTDTGLLPSEDTAGFVGPSELLSIPGREAFEEQGDRLTPQRAMEIATLVERLQSPPLSALSPLDPAHAPYLESPDYRGLIQGQKDATEALIRQEREIAAEIARDDDVQATLLTGNGTLWMHIFNPHTRESELVPVNPADEKHQRNEEGQPVPPDGLTPTSLEAVRLQMAGRNQPGNNDAVRAIIQEQISGNAAPEGPGPPTDEMPEDGWAAWLRRQKTEDRE
tara:strand:+ start:84 stop:1322 length:1239 start_codon:yes stop_codon:yes gene_type:complete